MPKVDALAKQFSKVLRGWLGAKKMKTVIARNHAEQEPGICHSHDFCDANMAMDQAFRDLGVHGMPDGHGDDAMTNAWNAAWDLAKSHNFYEGQLESTRDRIDRLFEFADQPAAVAHFNCFSLELPEDAVEDCSAPGQPADEAVAYWATQVKRPAEITPEKLAAELREYGAWDDGELADDDANWRRIIWTAACNIREERDRDEYEDDSVHGRD